ncbi:Glycyl-tRNA synthetase beta chain [hydrothermal vent metagenome]|uniref:glycine--tRNA ligase n=1 Tax=hydrothermal vent metagenome TaxID=652676 RepID=A0A3B1E0Y6_9ZZZZ
MIKPLLIEIAVEELPAIPFLKELPNIEKKWENILESNSLLCDFNFYYTPRRLVFWHREFKIAQDNKTVEMFGAPIKIAFENGNFSGKPTGAAIGFARKCGVSVDELDRIDQGRGEVLYFKSEVKGNKSRDLLNKMVNTLISSLNFDRHMKWGNRKDSFIRPVRGLSIVLGEELIDGELYGMRSTMTSFPHRMVSYEPFKFDFAGDYFCKLDNNGVILYQDERRKIILDQMKVIQRNKNITIDIDNNLLDEIVAITEYPTVLLGEFDEEFLNLPKEVIISSMKEHQRYFAVYENDKITNKFIVVSNAKTDDFSHIIAGNEKVLKPRLSDSMFFYKNDIKNGLSNKGLENITFVNGLGSVYEKCKREVKIALYLAKLFNIDDKQELLKKTIMMSKADLLTDMVYEFTNLQGLMGYYYAKINGEDQLLCTALKEQYLPDSESSLLPSNTFSCIVAISNKLDSIMGLFSVNMIPTGSRDPFGLRRASAGIFKICIEHNLHLDLGGAIDNSIDNYSNLKKDKVLEFMFERLYQLYNDINPSVIKSVIRSGETDLLRLSLKIKALNLIVLSSDFKELSHTFKRVSNIIKDIDTSLTLDVNTTLFEDNSEKVLYTKLTNITNKAYATYDEKLDALITLKPQLDDFFENVFVNHENKNIKMNRKNIIGKVYQSFKTIADIKEITI